MALNRQSLASAVPIVDRAGRPTPEFQRAWQGLSIGGGDIPPDTYVRRGLMSGWSSPTGTASKLTFATYAAPTAGAAYSQTQMQGVMNAAQVNSQHLKALIDDLKALGVLTS